MLRPRKEPDPLSGKRKLLAEQERLLAERMEKLNRRLANNGEEETGPPKPIEPPVWRLEEDGSPVRRPAEPAVANRRVLARQRQRDMLIFFVMIVALIVAVLLVLALAHTHLPGALPGS
jgi:hypothetical protein